jgi:glycerol-3-phosphate acyltransferase PlsY
MIIIAGLFVILGHVFHFYLQFKGGWGAASGLGILLFGIILWIVNGIHVPLYLIILFLAITLILVFSINHAFASSIMLLAFIFLFLFYEPFNLQASLILFSLAFLFLISLFELKLIINKKIKKKNERSTLKRKFLRPLAAVFPLGLLFNLKWIVLIVIGVVFLIFLAMEIIKFLRPKFKYFLLKYKAKEKRRISSMTLFLFSAGLTILIFDKYIAAMVLFFLVFGDLAAWALGKSFGKIKILDKSLEGSIACFLVCALIAFIFFKLFGFSLLIGLIGAFVASLVELSPIQEDNLAVPVITAIIMTFLKMVLII